MVSSFLNVPFGSSVNWQMIAKAADEYLKSRSHTCPLFSMLYSQIVHVQSHGRPPLDYGTEEHIERVFNGLRECSLLKRLGDRQKRSLWLNRSI